jgi:excisionase family DNA binding protein
MATMFYSTGQAACELSITQDRVRQLCEAGAVTAEITSGGQWRVPKAEIDRLKRDGLPPVPRPLPGADRSALGLQLTSNSRDA